MSRSRSNFYPAAAQTVTRLLLASRNAHKTREFAEILGAEFSVSDVAGVADLPHVEETGSTFEENAVLKAVAISRCVPGLVVADDSGLEVAALNGAPGILSARYAGVDATDGANLEKVLSELAACTTSKDRSARFRCALILARDANVVAVFHGSVSGKIIESPRGNQGFGYDPVFVPDGHDRTFAELGASVKTQISHRAVAIDRLRRYLLKAEET